MKKLLLLLVLTPMQALLATPKDDAWKYTSGAQDIWQLIANARTITLLPRLSGDGLWASAAFELVLLNLPTGVHDYTGRPFSLPKQVETVYQTTVNTNDYPIAQNSYVSSHNVVPDLIIIFDTTDKRHLYWPAEFENIPLICIDHHYGNPLPGSAITYMGGASTSGLVRDLILDYFPQFMNNDTVSALGHGIMSEVIESRNKQ